MEKMIVDSLKNTVLCAFKEAVKRAQVKSPAKIFNFEFENFNCRAKKKCFAVLEFNENSIDSMKAGMFSQAFSILLEKDNIKTSFRRENGVCLIEIFKPSKIKKEDFSGRIKLKINKEETFFSCQKKPKKVYVHKIRVRFRDLDAMGHVSNNVFLVYLEEARVGFKEHVAKERGGSLQFCSVVAGHSIEYLAPIFLGEELGVEIFISHLTEKSYRFNYTILNRKTKQIKARAYTNMVGYDYKKQVVKNLPEEFFRQIEDYVV
ncbi:hypothetical protein TTHT_1687 [Thermotomaculum hydrothermale]|uniref:Thioesterase superfamily protein n=1 Tax=Thermotomaculum hydrothermale TaxID=981385 RepID=A0A7R6PUX8_9BACT|nr:thioesterase family protein [Thermotomaculum hydrothermale]BBB33162.1 hypothetical protein TTHT_1687 [Thermotomaculum hydrothermale]